MNKISVIMNSYQNNADHLKQAIQSYLDQEGVEVEIIVSTVENDSAIEIAKSMGCVVVISKKPDIYAQINRALKKVTGKYVCYASGNDVAIPGKLKIESDLLIKSNKLVCYSAFIQTDENLEFRKTRSFYSYDYKKHLQGNYVSDCSMFSAELIEKYGPFQLKHKNHAFYDFWLRIAEGEGNVFVYNPVPTWLYRVSNDSRHIQRKKDPARIEENNNNRLKMLSFHGI